MTKLLLIVVLLCFSPAWAATYNAVLTGVTKNGAQYAIKSPTATINAGSVTTTAKVGNTATVSGGGISIAGQTITMPATATLAAGAAQVALTAVRLNPAGLMIGLTAQWLISEGLSYINGEWKKSTTSQSTTSMYYQGDRAYLVSDYGSSTAAAKAACCSVHWTQCGGDPFHDVYNYAKCRGYAGEWSGSTVYVGCYNGNLQNMSGLPSCGAGVITQTPAATTDFDAVAAKPLPDGAANELIDTVALPINTPTMQSSPVEVLGTPYLDPVSGRLVQERTIATPSPTAENPFAVRVEKYQQDAGAVAGQTAAPPALTTTANASNQPSNIEFPSDYGRQGEAQAAADSINTTLGAKIDKITETGADPADPFQPQGSQFDQSFFQGTFSNLLGWQLPAHTSQCPTGSFDWNATTYTINAHCQLITNHFSALSSVMSVVWTILALFILLGA